MYKFFVGNNITSFEDNGLQRPISRVTLKVDDENVLTAGDDTGMELLADCPHATQAMVDAILAKVKGYRYRMFSAGDAGLDPSAELGDGITAGGVYSVISRLSDDGSGFPGVAAPGEAELEDEYPEAGPMSREFNRKLAETRSSITKTAEEIRLEVKSVSDSLGETDKAVASLSVSLEEISSTVQDQNGNISTISQKVDEISTTVTDLSGNVSSISQKVDNISLSVTGSLGGGTASITLSSGGSKSGSIDLSGVRNAFANDQTAITISAGKVSFNAGLFAVNGDTFTIDEDSVSSVSGEYMASLSNGALSIYSTYTETINGSQVRHNDFIGKIGVNYWSGSRTGAKGLTFDLDAVEYGSYMAWGVKESDGGSYIVKLMYPAKNSLGTNGSGSFESDYFYIDSDFRTRNRFELCKSDDLSSPVGRMVGNEYGVDLYCIGDPGFAQIRFIQKTTPSDRYADDSTILTLYQGQISCEADLYMNNNNIYGESDECLKKNIAESNVSFPVVSKPHEWAGGFPPAHGIWLRSQPNRTLDDLA